LDSEKERLNPFLFYGSLIIGVFIFSFGYQIYGKIKSNSFKNNHLLTLASICIQDSNVKVSAGKGRVQSNLVINGNLIFSKSNSTQNISSYFSFSLWSDIPIDSFMVDTSNGFLLPNKYILNLIKNTKRVPFIYDSSDFENSHLLLTKSNFDELNLNRDSIISLLKFSREDKDNYLRFANLLDSIQLYSIFTYQGKEIPKPPN